MEKNYLDGRKCAALGCSSTSRNSKFFRFPRNSKERYQKWADIAKNPKLDVQSMTSSYLCGNHFASNQFRDENQTTLIFGAVPVAKDNSGSLDDGFLPPNSVVSDSWTHSTPTNKQSCATKLVFTNNVQGSATNNILSSDAETQLDALPNVDCFLETTAKVVTETPLPARRDKNKTVMNEINCSRFKYLTPKKQFLVRKCQKKERTLKLLRKKYQNKKISLERLCSVDSDPVKLVECLSKSTSITTAQFIASQVRCSNTKSQGRRWTISDKLLALVVYKRSPKAYALLRTIFSLPSKRTLVKLLNKIPFLAGINQRIFASLKKKLCSVDESDRICVLMFDEISIREHLEYSTNSDRIVGFEDLGILGRTEKIANHALVFMLKGLKGNWKQPVAFYFTRGGTPATKIVTVLKQVITACLAAGLNVVATVCDMATSNVSALKSMGVTTEKPYFIFNELKIVTIFDPPHLLKCLRNMLFKHNVEVKVNIGASNVIGTAKWQHILDAYDIDSKQAFFNLLHKLTKEHLHPTGFKAMKVSYAAQLLSHTVAATIECLVANGAMPSEAVYTAHMVGFTNKLFDRVNGSSSKPAGAQGIKCQVTRKRENLHLEFWDTAIKEIDSWKFERSYNSLHCSNTIKQRTFFRPPCQDGWIITLGAMKDLWSYLKDKNVQYLKVRSLKQDSQEHLFGLVRMQCGSNTNPTVSQFVASLKSCIINGLASEKFKGHNCETRDTSTEVLLDNLHSFLSPEECTTLNVSAPIADMLEKSQGKDDEIVAGVGILSVSYVSGFIASKLLIGNQCSNCKNSLCTTEPLEYIHSAITFREYSEHKRGLTYPSEQLVETVAKAVNLVDDLLPKVAHRDDVKEIVVNIMKEHINFVWLQENCKEHGEKLFDRICDGVCRISLPWWRKKRNREITRSVSDHNGKARKLKILQHK